MKISLEIEGKNACSIKYKGPDCIDLAVTYLNSIQADEIQVRIAKDDGTKADAEFDGKLTIEFCICFRSVVFGDAHLYFIGLNRIKVSDCKINAIRTFILYTASIFSFDLKTYFHDPLKIGELTAHRGR